MALVEAGSLEEALMARGFNGSTDQATGNYWNGAGALAAASVSFWFYPTALVNAYMGLVQGATADFFYLKSSGALALYTLPGNPSSDPVAGFTASTNTWYNLVFVSNNGVESILYINGSVVVSTMISVGNYLGMTTVNLGFDPNNAGRNFAGRMADIAFWNVELTALEATSLARGVRPNRIRPASLKQYLPLFGLASPEPDLGGGAFNSTMTGTALAFGPPVGLLTPRRPVALGVAAGPSFNPAWAIGKNVVVEGVAT
jgi:hypothetical protein